MKMKLGQILVGTTIWAVASFAAPQTYNLDVAHTHVGFSIKHLGITSVPGKFEKFVGSFQFDDKTKDLSQVQISIEAASITTNHEKRDKHLRSPDFFEVEKFPKITFTSKSVKKGKKGLYSIKGDFEMHGVKKEVTLKAKLNGSAKSPWGQEVVSFEASTVIPRKAYGLTWNKALETGGFLVGEDANIELKVEAIKDAGDTKK